jgi:CO/xanthine dehydrogenase Mo-binding subunit
MAKIQKHLDVYRAVQDHAYAAKLSRSEWLELINSPEYLFVMGEHPEWRDSLLNRHQKILRQFGILEQARALQEDTGALGVGAKEEYSVIGQPILKYQGPGIVSGVGQYVENMSMPGMVHQAALRSPHPHAIIRSIDTSKAEALPGVVDIIHFFNLDESENARTSGGPPARFLFDLEVMKVGDAVAVVAAESWHIAEEATRLIEVEYEVLPAVLDMFVGMQESTPKQWENELPGTIINLPEPDIFGDPDAAFAEADLVVEVESSRSTESHVALEVTSSLMYWDEDRLVVYLTTQWAHGARNTLAQRLGIAQNNVKVINTGYMGSGYGFRGGIAEDEVYSAILARRTGRPVKRVATRSEDFITRGHRPQFKNTVRLGLTSDGTITALHANVIANVGAQRAGAATGSFFGYENLYAAPNIKLEGTDVFTNTYVSGPYRCVSHPAATLGLEVTIDEAANRLGMDPVELRLKNFNLVGNPFNGNPFSNPGIATTLTEAARAIDWANKWHAPGANEVRPGVFHGIGIACHTCSHGGGLGGSGQVHINADGTMNVVSGSTEIGSGQRTHMLMIAAEAMGIPLDMVKITPYVDTDLTTDTIGTFGSLQTNTGGSGVFEAAMDARRQIFERAVPLFLNNLELEVTADQLDIKDGMIYVIDNPEASMSVADVVRTAGLGGIVGNGKHSAIPGFTRAAYATQAGEIEVDTVTGSIVVTNWVAAHDIGKAINTMNLRSQIHGGTIMALGAALTEEMLIDIATGLPLTDNILEYKALSIKDVPRHIEVILVEHARSYGVFGAHGIGEPPMGMAGPVISNALFNALGVRITAMPFTRDKVLAALAQ